MKFILAFCIFIAVLTSQAAPAATIYVDIDASGTNNGTSWANAYTDLQSVLDVATSGDEIWVAEGTYKPSMEHGGTGDRYKTFQMKNGVGIYGGFDPTVGDDGWAERDWVNNVTILSGDIGTEGDNTDNCIHVFYNEGLDSTAIIDGFIITVADGFDQHTSYRDNHGGGMFNNNSSPTITNCIFSNNSARSCGGGMYNDDNSSPTITNCTFSGNSSFDGGGMHNNDSSPTLTNCTFSGNSSFDGGGMYNHKSSPTLINCTFSGNTASENGGGMYNGSSSSSTLTNCTFSGNTASENGGGMYNGSSSSSTLTNCTFSGNTASEDGGGMYNYPYPLASSITITNCIFSNNSADGLGGGINNSASSLTLLNCTFSGNFASSGGGGMSNGGASSVTIANCIFTDNSTSGLGGGIMDGFSIMIMTNCTFYGNSADNHGGGIYNIKSPTPGPRSPVLTNCIFWGNTAIAGNSIYNFDGNSPVTANDCDIQGGYIGIGNITSDPLFTDPANGDFHLKLGSPCIDRGDNIAPNIPTLDFEGDNRIIDGNMDGMDMVDMGADEFSYCTTFNSLTNTLNISCLNLGNSSYWVRLGLISSSFEIISFGDNWRPGNILECTSFNSQSNILHIPCVYVGGISYWINLQLIVSSDPLCFNVIDYGTNQ